MRRGLVQAHCALHGLPELQRFVFFFFLISRSRFYDLQVRIKIWNSEETRLKRTSTPSEKSGVPSTRKEVAPKTSANTTRRTLSHSFFLARRVGVIMHAMCLTKRGKNDTRLWLSRGNVAMSLGEDVHVVLVEKKRTTYVSKANDRPLRGQRMVVHKISLTSRVDFL